ncbi:MAG: dihydrodipicolinate synthase family protein [Opitutales bacterium]|nr:dihydrodipicolinate synthase family protein [Opitutales bacterium]
MNPVFPSEGILVALWLPVDEHGSLDRPALRQHFAWLRGCGIHGVMALGSSGRFPLMDVKWRRDALEFFAELAEDLPVIANVSDIRPAVVAELGRAAKGLGLAGISVMPPWFYRAGHDDQLAFFEAAADAADLPVLIYNFPELTGNRIAAETVAAFADRRPMGGIKQSGGEFDYHRELIALGREKNFAVFSGSDTRLPEVFELGAAGCIGGLVNIVPEYMVAQFNHHRRGVPMDLEPTRSRMAEVGRIVDRLPLPVNVMAGVEARGWKAGSDVSILSAETRRVMDEVAYDLRKALTSWNLPLGPLAKNLAGTAE